MKRILLLPVLLFLCAAAVFSIDYGALINLDLEAANSPPSPSAALTPWFSWNNGEGASVYLSAIITLEGGAPMVTPELGHFALNYRFGPQYSIDVGRVGYADVMGFTASGLFDGFRFTALTSLGSISAGAYYSGFQYKETAEIKMTGSDHTRYEEGWGLNNFGAYFASRRAIGAVRWDIPLGEAHTVTAEALAQFDLNGDDDALHSQYGEIHAEIYLPNMMSLNIGALYEAMENKDGDFTSALGAQVRFRMDVPGSLNDRLSITAKVNSGLWNDDITAFTPISSHSQGMVFPEKIFEKIYTTPGLAYLSADYFVRLFDSLFVDGGIRYFARTWDYTEPEGVLYGAELSASLNWQPLDDLRLSMGLGAFFPGLGNINPDGNVLWKFTAGLAFSL